MSVTSGLPSHLNSDSDDSTSTICEPSTDVFIVVSFGTAGLGVRTLLRNALGRAESESDGGGIIPTGGWRQIGGSGESLVIYSDNGQVFTYEILCSALRALINWMTRPRRTFGSCSFTVWSGLNMVGYGQFSVSSVAAGPIEDVAFGIRLDE